MATVTKGKGPCVELAALQKMANDLCNALPIDDLFPSMISHRVIDFIDKADVCAERTERRRVEHFLEYLTKGLNLDTTHFYRFLTVMERSPKCNFLVKRMKRCVEECKEELAKSEREESLEIMLAKLKQAKAGNKTLKVSYTTVLFCGSSGVGKTSLMKKLNKEQLARHHDSTGVAKSKHTICVKTTAVVKSAEGLQWTDLDYDLMINQLNKYLRSLPEENKLENDLADSSSELNSDSVIEENVDDVENDIAKADSFNTPSLGEVWNIINFLDTGGQPEFVNILPAVSSSVGLTFIVFDLSKRLDSSVYVQHNVKGDPSFEPYYLDCTNMEFIKRLMVSSENFNKKITPYLKLKNIQREDDKNDTKNLICYVGTHALNISEKEIKEIDGQLSSVSQELELCQRLCWSSPKESLKQLFPVEMFPDVETRKPFEDIIEDIRDSIQKQVQTQGYYEVPITWFIFLLKLQKLCSAKNVSFISYQEAVGVWMDKNNVNETELRTKSDQDLHEDHHNNISQENSDVHNSLLFFHFMGMLFYYHEVKGICDFVFIDRQWLFEKLTELVEIKFTKCYNKKDINVGDLENFKMQGRLSISIINNLKIDLQGIQPLHFIYLLDHLNIVAPFDAMLKEYFMPCVLPSFSLTQSYQGLDMCYGTIQQAPSLLVGFKNGPIPHGFFCQLIVELFRKLPPDWKLPYISTSRTQHVYNNLITFPTASAHAVSLFYKYGYLEIQVRRKESKTCGIHFNVRHELDKALRKVSNNFQLNLRYGFYCNCEDTQHFAELEELTLSTGYIHCDYGSTKLTEEHKMWLQEVRDSHSNTDNQHSMNTGKELLDVEKRLELQKEVFTNCRQYIVRFLSPDDVMDTLFSKSLIGDSAYQQLRLPSKTPQEKNRTIVDELSSGGPGVFEEFCAILKKNRRAKHIADHLEKEWRELLQSLQNDGEQLQYSPPVHTKVVTAPPQANMASTTTRRQRENIIPQQVMIQETTTDPVDQGHITAPTKQPVSESRECHEDSNTQEVTSPVSESEEGYYQSTGIDLKQERNGAHLDVTGAHLDVTGVHLDDTGVHHDVTGAHLDVTGAHRDVTGAHRDVTGAHCDVTGAHRDITGAHHDVTGAHLDVTGAHHGVTGAHHDVTGAHRDVTGAHRDVTGVHYDVTGAHHDNITGAHHDVTGAHHGVTGAHHDVTGAHHVVTAATAPPASSNEDCLVTGKDSKRCMRLMRAYVIPKISEEWEAVAAFLDYSIQAKNDIVKEYKTPKQCCKALLEDWVTTDNGVKPKTWKKLMEVLSEVDELEEVIDEIKRGLISEEVVLDAPKEYHPHLEDQQGHPHQFTYNPEDQSTDDATDHDHRCNQQPESSAGTMAGSELLQTNMNNRPSYNLPSVEVDQRYGKQMGANQQPQPVYRQPHAFIVYAKEVDDPHGEQVRCLCDLLHNCGIDCYTDLYYINENDTDINWPYWVENNLRNYIAYPHCYVILVCSPTMMSLLGNAEAHVEMIAAIFHSDILRYYLQHFTKKFLPLLINDPSSDYVPPNLAGQKCCYFPYYKLNDMPENISTFDVIRHPDFASLKSLVDMLLTGQQEIPVADQEQPEGEGVPTADANTT